MTAAYRYRAARSDGSIERGVIAVADRQAAIEALRVRALVAIDLEGTQLEGRVPAIPAADLAIGLRMLSTLLAAGMPISRALTAFADIAPRTWADANAVAMDRVRQGDGLARAFDQAGAAFPAVLIGIIRAGEEGSGLASSVSRAAALAESSAALRASLRNALAYPAVIAGVGGTSLGVVLGVILPRFAAIIADLGVATPPLARVALAVSAAMRVAWWPTLLIVAALLGLWHAWIVRAGNRLRWHEVLSTVPLLGRFRHASASARCCAALSALLESGVPIAVALPHAARATGDLYAEARIMQARERIVGGARISSALAEARAVTETAQRFIRAGEESGHLAAMLEKAGEIDAELLASRVRTVVRLVEPSLIVAFAGAIGFVAAALLQAVYAVRPA